MTYDDISLGTWMRMQREAEGMNDIERNVSDISILSGIDFDDLYSMDLREFAKVQAKYSFLNERIPTRMVTEFEGKPITLDFAKLQFGDFVDLMEILKKDSHAYDLIIAKLWRSDLPLNDAAKVVREHMPITIAMGLSGFFFDYWQDLERRILRYLQRKVKREMMRLRFQAVFYRITRGLYGLTHWLRVMRFGGSKLK
jgi:hypothetical protein